MIDELLKYEGDEDDDDEDLVVPVSPALAPAVEKPKKPRYQCAGARRRNEDDKPLCDYKAYKKWTSRPDGRGGLTSSCPKCKQNFACVRIRTSRNESRGMTLGAAGMATVKPIVYHATGIKEFDYVLGGGVVFAKTIMVGARRGAGKSTLLLQACSGFAQNGRKAYFASGEMTQEAVAQYAQRLGILNENVRIFADPQGIDLDDLFQDVLAFGAKLLVVDSLQVCFISRPNIKAEIGSPAMLKNAINMISSFGQAKKRAILAIGHLIGDGDFGGGQGVQHLADGLLMMDNKYNSAGVDTKLRELRWAEKSRQCSDELKAVVEFTPTGMMTPSRQRLYEAGLSMLHSARS